MKMPRTSPSSADSAPTDGRVPDGVDSPAEVADSMPAGAVRGRRIDVWMTQSPWHPRVAPEMMYLVLLALSGQIRQFFPPLYPLVYVIQCGATAWILWRYRKLLTELTLSFHWISLPAGALVFVVWMLLGNLMEAAFSTVRSEPWDYFKELGLALGWVMLALKFMGMCLVVPVFEELFNRSLLLRSFSHFRRSGIGIMNLAQDMPVLEDVLLENKWAKKAVRHRNVFTDMFEDTPLGKLTWLGVTVSTLVFMLAHVMRDWPGAIFCGVAYCGVVWWTNRGDKKLGLGPVIWAHAITNAMLWVYTVVTHIQGRGDWRFM